MKIAILGWGSLLWKPTSKGKTLLTVPTMKWQKDGPEIPLEFCRISKDNRLTLVAEESYPVQRCYWILHQYADVELGLHNLKDREGTSIEFVASIAKSDSLPACPIKHRVWEWIQHRPLDAVIWTALKSNFQKPFSPEEAVKYLRDLVDKDAGYAAKEYFTKTPPQIQTATRDLVRTNLGWSDESDQFWSHLID